MLGNYIVVAVRSFLKRKLYSFINVAGLAVSLACAIFITLFIRNEASYDAELPGSAQIYQLTSHFNLPGSDLHQTFLFAPYGVTKVIASEVPGIEEATAKRNMVATVKVGDRQFLQDVGIASENFFRLIRLPFLQGDPAGALSRPDNIVLTADTAKTFFGDARNVLGRNLRLDGRSYRVSAVLKNPLPNSQFWQGAYVSNAAAQYRVTGMGASWFSVNDVIFVRTQSGFDPQAVQEHLTAMVRRHADATQVTKAPITGDKILQIGLHPLTRVHLDAPEGTISSSGRTMIRGFAAIALLILIIAAFNFTNLSTACASLRAREVGLRKTMGALKRQLRIQFLCESVLTALIALILALSIVELLLPGLNGLLDRSIRFSVLSDYPVGLAALGMALFCGLLGGIYPAIVLSRFRPGMVLKSGGARAEGSGRIRTMLVVAQFAISIGLGIVAIVVAAQIGYARNLDIGFQRDNIVVIMSAGALSAEKQKTFVKRLENDSHIAGAVRSHFYPLNNSFNAVNLRIPGTGEQLTAEYAAISPGYFRLYGIRSLAGRVLDDRHSNDQMSENADQKLESGKNILVEARLARQLGFSPQEAIGKIVDAGMGDFSKVRIVGVLDDVKYHGPQAQRRSDPILYAYPAGGMSAISVRIRGGHVEAGLNAIDTLWRRMAPDTVIRRHFMDERFDRQFNNINRQVRLFGIFVGIAIFTACLGLFGLAAFAAERRAREISIRKIFGATRWQIVRLLVWQFSIPVLIANLIAWPGAYLWLRHWLSGYAYHVALSPFYFAAAGVIALAIACATVSAHAFRTASASPVSALRSE